MVFSIESDGNGNGVPYRVLKTVFFGTLRPTEIEVSSKLANGTSISVNGKQLLTDRMKSTIFDILLIMTIFRDDFSTHFLVLLTMLLLSKTFHWLAQDRVDYVRLIMKLLLHSILIGNSSWISRHQSRLAITCASRAYCSS